MEITEQQFLDACTLIKNYQKQINLKVQITLHENGINLSPNEIFHTWDIYFPTMSNKLWSLLVTNFRHHTLKHIDKELFMKTQGCGAKSWDEFNTIIKTTGSFRK